MKKTLTTITTAIITLTALAGCSLGTNTPRENMSVTRIGFDGNFAQYEVKTGDGRSLTCIALHDDRQNKDAELPYDGSLSCDWAGARNLMETKGSK